MEVEDAFEKWLSDWVSRNPAGELSPKTVWFVASRWGYGQNADRIAALEAERDAYKAEAKLLEHKVITCGVAASHSDADLTRTGAYAEKWNSQQAEQVRKLRAERDALRKVVEWVAVSEKEPPLCVTVLLAAEFDGPGDWRVKCGGLTRDRNWHVFGADWTPTYWKPLPTPPSIAIAAKEPNRE